MSILMELLDWGASAFVCMLILRVYFQYTHVSFYHPLGDWILKLTTPILQPLRKFIPHHWNWFGLDWTAIVIALAFYWLWHGLMFGIERGTFTGYFWSPIEWFASLPNALFGLIHALVSMVLWMILLHVIISWTSHLPIAWLEQAIRPWLLPLQRLLPTFQGLDFSPWVLIIVLKILLHVLEDMMPVSHPRGLHAILALSPFQ